MLHEPPGVLVVPAGRPVGRCEGGGKVSPKDFILQLLELPLASSDVNN